MPYLLVLERASGTHKHSVQQALGLLTSTCSVVCLFPQVHSNKLRLAALEVPGFIFLWCLGAQRKGMVISMEEEMDFENRILTPEYEREDSDIEGSLRPKTLQEYIGQEKAKENMSIYIEAARMRGEPLDHVLLYGPPGLGKTTLSGIIANEMNVNLRITSGPAIEKP